MGDKIEYLDFEVNIDATDSGDFTIQINSLGGSVKSRFKDPFTTDKRTIFRKTLETAVFRSLTPRLRSLASPELNTMKELGSTLFDQAIRENLREFYYKCLGQAQQQGKGLRLRLAVDPKLSDLPWEFLCTTQDGFLALDPKTPVVRYIELANPAVPLETQLPLHLLVVIASPKELVMLDSEAEKRRIAEALSPLQEKGLVEVSYIEGPDTWGRLIKTLRANDTHILHFIGHGTFDEESKEGLLAMENEDGGSQLIGSERLRILLQGKSKLRLAVLNACQGAVASESEPLSSVAAAMVRSGIPAVVAMQFEVSDKAAQIIAETFYQSLALNFPVDAALTESRRQIALLYKDSLEWATPVLYMQVSDGQLFNIQSGVPNESKGKKDTINTGEVYGILETLYQRGEQSFSERKWQDALKCFRAVAVQNADYKDVAIRIAELERILGGGAVGGDVSRPQPGGEPVRSKGIDLVAKAAETYQAAQAAEARGDWDEAANLYQGAMFFVPNYKDAPQRLAYCQRRKQCRQLYEQARRQYENKQYAQVLDTLRQLRAMDPLWEDEDELEARANLGIIYLQALTALRAGDRQRGAESLRSIVVERPDFEDVIDRLQNLAQGGDGLFGESYSSRAVVKGEPGEMAPSSQPVSEESPEIEKPGDERKYELAQVDIAGLAEEIRQFFLKSKMETQIIQQDQVTIIQGKSSGWMNWVGMGQAATVMLESTPIGLKASVGGGKWIESGAAIAVSLFVLWPLAITGGIGMAKNKLLNDSVWQMIETHVNALGGRRID
jgi:tetratricopeptide (TPR) repeat protein